MSENTFSESKNNDRAVAVPESVDWYEKFYHPAANDLRGKECAKQPGHGQVAHLEPGKKTKGCDYQTDTSALYAKAKSQSVYIESRIHQAHHKKDSIDSGSGVIVGKRGDQELLILTDNHVVGGDKGIKLKEVKVRTADGDINEGKVVNRRVEHDQALVSIKVTPEQMSKFEVATAVKSLAEVKPGQKVLGLGFPMDSEYLYESRGKVETIAPEKSLVACDPEHCYGDDVNRQMIRARLSSREGNSGGGVWNMRGQLIGNIDGSADNNITTSLLNTVTQDVLDNMIRHAKPYEKP